MSLLLSFVENGLHIQIVRDGKGRPRLVHLSPHPAEEQSGDPSHDAQLVSLQGEQSAGRYIAGMGNKQHLTIPGLDLVYQSHTDARNAFGRKIVFSLSYEGLCVALHWQFFDGIPVLRSWVDVANDGPTPHTLEALPSFFQHNISASGKTSWETKSRIHLCSNAWCAELQWRTHTLVELGLLHPREQSSNRIRFSNTGSWSTKEFLPLALYENSESGDFLFWQIETNGSWNWEISDHDHQLYLSAGGPDEASNHWFRRLNPGESFSSVPVAIGWVHGTRDDAFGVLTRYRRASRRRHWDNERLPVIFNDYMNCLFADPTTDKELPLIAAAAAAGAEIYVIDAGWYARRGINWWVSVGEWQPSPDRFEGGLETMLGTIRKAGMIPGLWLELEVMGTECPLASKWPEECFFQRHGRRVIHRGRYQLDYRHPIVITHANEVVDRLVRHYGVGYIKMDYNIDIGPGSEVGADSCGDGLLQHNRAYLAWLDAVFTRHPELIIENCSSGGLRMDYALLSRHTIQSTSDQEDFLLTGAIAASAATGATPEQQAVWSYPKRDASRDQVVFNMVNTMLCRIHQSGHLAELSEENRALVAEAIRVYKTIRSFIPIALPFWPTGLPGYRDSFFSSGLKSGNLRLLALWKVKDARTVFKISMPELAGSDLAAEVLFPPGAPTPEWKAASATLLVTMEAPISALLLRLKLLTCVQGSPALNRSR